MIEVAVRELRTDDIGHRVLVIHDGGTVEGKLQSIRAYWWEYSSPEPDVRTEILVTNGGVKVEIGKLPGEYVLQIERDF